MNSDQCQHEEFVIYGWNDIREATCAKCGVIIGLDDALNTLTKRVRHLEDALARIAQSNQMLKS